MPARVPRLQPSTGERPQDSDDGEEKNGMASLVVCCRKNNWGCILFRSLGAAICPLPSCSAPLPRPRGSSSGSSNGSSTIKGTKRNLSARHASCRNGERLHFLATAQTNQLALEGARVLDPACFREAIGDPKNARQAGMTSAASIFFLI
jgi:hypothetical protein